MNYILYILAVAMFTWCVLRDVRIQGDSILPCSHECIYVCAQIKFPLKTSASFDALESHDDNENMAARVQSVQIYQFTCRYENGVSVGIRFGRRFQISPFLIFV